MNFLEAVQSLHYESKLPGSPPASVVGQTGRAADLVRWTAEAWNDIQRERDGKWKWLRAGFTLDTTASDPSYTYGDCTDVATAVAITRFRAWDLDWREPTLIYLVSEGEATERELCIEDWPIFRSRYVRATHTDAPPSTISSDAANVLYLGPTPDGVYRVTGDYWRSNQALAENEDTPEMPADYHMLIPYRALTKYAYNTVGHEVLARARAEGVPMYEALVLNQAYSRFSMTLAGALA
jgi:hypothetical protein